MRTWRPRGPNATLFLWTEAPWSLAMAWQASYLTVYLVASGLPPAGVGLAVGLGGLVQIFGLMGSGWLVDVLGRKAVIMAGDFLGWVIVLGIWVLEPKPLFLALGIVLMNGTAFVTPAWNSLFSEDVAAEKVSFYYMVLQQLTLFGGIAIPLMAPWVQHLGVKASGHLALVIVWPLVAIAWTARALWLRESSVGRAQREARRGGRHAALGVKLRLGLIGVNRPLAALRILTQVSLSLFATLAPLVLISRHAESLPPADLAFLPLASSVAAALVLLTHNRWRDLSPRLALTVALGLLAAGMAGLALGPAHSLAAAMVVWGLVAGGQAMFWTVHTAFWMAMLPDVARVEVQGWVGAGSAILLVVLAPLLASHVDQFPRLVSGLEVLPVIAGLAVLALWPSAPIELIPDA